MYVKVNWINLAAESTHKMQKYLRLLNFRLDVVVNDVCGQTGDGLFVLTKNEMDDLLAKQKEM